MGAHEVGEALTVPHGWRKPIRFGLCFDLCTSPLAHVSRVSDFWILITALCSHLREDLFSSDCAKPVASATERTSDANQVTIGLVQEEAAAAITTASALVWPR